MTYWPLHHKTGSFFPHIGAEVSLDQTKPRLPVVDKAHMMPIVSQLYESQSKVH